MRKLCAFLAVPLLLFAFSGANAVLIDEIMYDAEDADTGHEWLEIYNNDSIPINLTGWKLFEDGTNHGLALNNGAWILSAGEFAVIAENPDTFRTDFPNFNSTLFDSTFVLSNSGEYLVLKNSSLYVFENITYNPSWGADGDGKSLQRTNSGTWCSAAPTPSYENTCDAPPDEPQTTSDSCDLQLKINASSVYNAGGDINYKIIVEDIQCSNIPHHYSVSYEIEDLFGNHLSSPRTSDYDINCRDTSSHNKQADEICGISAYKIKARLMDSGCDDLNTDNDRDEFIFVVKGKNPADCTAFQNSELFPSKTSNKYSGEIISFYTLAKNLYAGREINLFASIENSANFSRSFELVLEDMKKTIEIPPKSSQKTNFSVTLPAVDANFTLQLFQGNNLLDEKSLFIELENAPQVGESYNKTAPAGTAVWASEKISSLNLAMVFLIAVLLVFVFTLLASKTKQNDLN